MMRIEGNEVVCLMFFGVDLSVQDFEEILVLLQCLFWFVFLKLCR